MARFEPAWIEEPLLSEDLRAHADLRSVSPAPIALGENLSTVYQVKEALLLGACDIVQPNVVRVGGITPFLRIAALVQAFGARLAPHLLPEISGLLALTLPQTCEVEDVEDASLTALGLVHRPGVAISDGWLSTTDPPPPGLGVQVCAVPVGEVPGAPAGGPGAAWPPTSDRSPVPQEEIR
jgi:L-alanine-DL-glutamate epimerase-like enolase superfamily enzyme